MARIRSIKPDFFKHHDLYSAEVESNLPLRLAFAGLWTCADLEGRFKWRPPQLKLDVLPYDDVNFEKVLESLEKFGFIIKYSVLGDDFAFIPTFKDHQRITGSEATTESKIPCPSASCKQKKRNTKETLRKSSGNNKDDREGKGKEGKGNGREMEGKGVDDSEPLFKLQKIYDKTWEEYKTVLNGQSEKLSEIIFIKWKEFVDFIWKNNYQDIFRCKFVSPIDFGVLLTKNKFLENKWEDVVERILSVGVTPQQNLFFRIPQFIEYTDKNKQNGKGNITGTKQHELITKAHSKAEFGKL